MHESESQGGFIF